MKKLNYLFTAILMAVLAIGCDPVEDINERLAANEPGISTVLDYTITDDDYETLELSFGNFSSMEDAETLIPQILSENFPVLGENSLANVTFLLYDPIRVEDYTVIEADYAESGLDRNYFSGLGEIQDFLEIKYPQASEGDFIELTYDVLADEIPYTLTVADFDLIGDELAAQYPGQADQADYRSNFERREGEDDYWTDEMILDALNVVLSERFANVPGQNYNVSYAVWVGEAAVESSVLQFDGNSYVEADLGQAYELTETDYDDIAVEFDEEYPNPASNAGRFSNFETRDTSGNYWSDDMLEEALAFVLETQFPDAEVGAKFQVTYATYNGNSGVGIKPLVNTEDGFIFDDNSTVSTITDTNIFALTTQWGEPYRPTSEDYRALGQEEDYFSSSSTATFRIGRYLDEVYPFLMEGDYVAVAYNYEDDGEISERYAKYVYENGEFVNIPSVVETSLQFGHDGTTWVPDNTIAYSLTAADYAFIATELEDEYPAQTSSMAQYGNLDRRSGNAAFWSDDMIVEALALLLNDFDPSAEEGQKYAMTFDIYNGSNTTETFFLIKTDGEWVMQ